MAKKTFYDMKYEEQSLEGYLYYLYNDNSLHIFLDLMKYVFPHVRGVARLNSRFVCLILWIKVQAIVRKKLSLYLKNRILKNMNMICNTAVQLIWIVLSV